MPAGSRAAAESNPDESVQLLGLHFPNRIGLAAGFDKNARYIDPLGRSVSASSELAL